MKFTRHLYAVEIIHYNWLIIYRLRITESPILLIRAMKFLLVLII